MFSLLKRITFTLAVFGGTLILLFWVLNMLRAHAPAPISTIASKAEQLMQPG